MSLTLTEVQRIRTSGARAVEPFVVDGHQLLAIPQLALDVPGQEPNMNGGSSDTELLLLRRSEGRYIPWSTLPAPGGEDAEFFTIGDQAFLAVASLRSGSGPYDFATTSQIFRWDGGRFVAFQAIQTFAAKQWKHWSVGGRHFLGLAQGVQPPGVKVESRDSVVYEWNGSCFVEHQRIPSQWAYNWHPFSVDGRFFVAHAEHLGSSWLYRWDGEQLVPQQILLERAGRAFATFVAAGESYLVAAGLLDPPTVLRWNGETFVTNQVLEGLGARELAAVQHDDRQLVVRVNFILGTPADPHPILDSQVYVWDSGSLKVAAEFPTSGGTDVAVIDDAQGLQLVVSNSLSSQLRFATDTVIYAVSATSA